MTHRKYVYISHFCDENIWHLCNHPDFQKVQKKVLIVSNRAKSCVFHYHKISPSIWDYHVIMVAFNSSWLVYDLDSTLPIPCPLNLYLGQTFDVNVQETDYDPKFRILKGQDYVSQFSSDRSHMRNADGSWIASPPVWPMIQNSGSGFDLKSLTDFENPSTNIVGLKELQRLFAHA